MPGNLRYGLTSGLSTASKKRRPGSHYLESPFLLSKYGPELYTRFISSPGWDLIAQDRQQRLTSFLGVYYTDITQYITLCPPLPPPRIPRNAMILQHLLLTTTWIWT